tara:strand:- start:305 stop:526 length:222 start_codon:yes stop_codon:yes gene_type:complete
MFQKICQIASLLSLLLSVSMLGGGYFAYKYITSPQLKNKIMNEIMANVQQSLPKVLDNKIPNVTGPSIQLPQK